ncbi:hypothetical protein M407DRAFT_26471 [Tulasnella calospora MUT 4182]|uniref:Uncharacterized protein n=1 Tax=Tulasnella calospora MUT 4182 TaxID=1051891 RepID=A0A0C3Q4X5_9AGAM|nr:hypothetical protein M407DRAFT_26471 [Tulasnella calospora MUT 4182]
MGYLASDSIHHLYPSWTFKHVAWRNSSRKTPVVLTEAVKTTDPMTEASAWTYGRQHALRLTFDPVGKAESRWYTNYSEGHVGRGAQLRPRAGDCKNAHCLNFGQRVIPF